MINKIYYDPKDREQWLLLRTKFAEMGMTGGSDAATIINANEYKSALELFYQAVGFTPWSKFGNEKMSWGTLLEDKIAEMYQYYDFQTASLVENFNAKKKVNSVRNVNAILINDKYPNLFANIDKYLPDIDGIGEIKNISGFVLDAYKDPNEFLLFENCPIGVPVGYYTQIQQYMLVYEKDRGRLIFNRDGSKLIIHEVKKDERLQEHIVDAANDFALRVRTGRDIMANELNENKRLQLLSEIEPPVTNQDSYNKFRTLQIQERELEIQNATMTGSQEQWEMGMKYLEADKEIKEANYRKNEAGNFLKTEFIKNGVEKLDFKEPQGIDGGYISMKRRLSVKLKF